MRTFAIRFRAVAALGLILAADGAFAQIQIPPSKQEQARQQLEGTQAALSALGTAGEATEKLGSGSEGLSGLARGAGLAVGATTNVAGAGLSTVQTGLSAAECARDPGVRGCTDVLKHGGDAIQKGAAVVGKTVGIAGAVSESAQVVQHADKALEYLRSGDEANMYSEGAQALYHGASTAAHGGIASGNPVAVVVGGAWNTGVAIGEATDWASKQLTGRVVLENVAELDHQARLRGYFGLQDAETRQRYREQTPGTEEWSEKLDRDAHELWYERYQAPRDAAERRQSFEALRSSNEYAAQLEARHRAEAEMEARQSPMHGSIPSNSIGFDFVSEFVNATAGQGAEFFDPPLGASSGCRTPSHNGWYCDDLNPAAGAPLTNDLDIADRAATPMPKPTESLPSASRCCSNPPPGASCGCQ